jgi:hypothetical protein
MPLALVAIASALDRDRIDVVIIDGRLEKNPIGAVVAASRDAVLRRHHGIDRCAQFTMRSLWEGQ